MIEKYNIKYEKVITRIGSLITKKNYSRACNMIRYCALHKYDLNDIFYDNRLEKSLQAIAFDYKIDTININDNKLVFYDQVSNDNRVLSMHYLNGFIQSGLDIIYIYYDNDSTNTRIRDICSRSCNVKAYSIGKKYNLKSFIKLLEIIKSEKPCKIFSQNHVDDFVGVLLNYALECTGIKRYLINITDHAFWLGQNAYDFIIEFRDYGYSLTIDERNIKADKLVKLPYYAFKSRSEFKGFEFETAGKKIVFSGGGIYKTKGDDTFFNIINHILEKYEDTIFLYLGANASDYVLSKIN